jgi:hypothetical protein
VALEQLHPLMLAFLEFCHIIRAKYRVVNPTTKFAISVRYILRTSSESKKEGCIMKKKGLLGF